MNIFEEVESLFEAAGNEVIAVGRKVPDKKLEGAAAIKAILDIARRHRELIEVGEEAGEESVQEHIAQQFMPFPGHKLL